MKKVAMVLLVLVLFTTFASAEDWVFGFNMSMNGTWFDRDNFRFSFNATHSTLETYEYTLVVDSLITEADVPANTSEQVLVELTGLDDGLHEIIIQIGSNSSDTLYAGTDTTAPDTPPLLAAVEPVLDDELANTGNLMITWIPDAVMVHHYNLYRSNSEIETAVGMEPYAELGLPPYFDYNVTNGTKYYYAITEVDNLMRENKSLVSLNLFQTVLDEVPPNVTQLLVGMAETDYSVFISWLAVTEDESGYPDRQITYLIYRDVEGEDVTNIANTTATEYADHDVLQGTTYHYVVYSLDDGGNLADYVTEGVNEVNVTTLQFPAPPTLSADVVEDSDNDGNIELSWSEADDAVRYRLYRSSTNITSAVNLTAIAEIDGTEFEDNTTLHNVTYWYALTSLDQNLDEIKSQVSLSFSATANDSIIPNVTQNVVVENMEDGSIGLTWDPVLFDVEENADIEITYMVFRTAQGDDTMVNIANTTLLTYTDSNVSEGDVFEYMIDSRDDAGNQNGAGEYGVNTINATVGACTSPWSSYSACASRQKSRTKTCYGNVITETRTCTSGGGGGGGSSRGGPSVNRSASPKKTLMWEHMTPGAASIMKITDPVFGIKQIVVNVRNQKRSVTMTVIKLDGQPATVMKQVDGKVFKYLEIKLDTLGADDLETSTLTFSVPKSWLEQNGVSKENVRLYRYVNGEWKELVTRLTTTTATDYTFEASTPGFSYFAIAAKEDALVVPPAVQPSAPQQDPVTAPTVVPDEVAPVAPPEDGKPVDEAKVETKGTQKSSMGIFAIVLVAVLLGSLGTLYFFYKKSQKTEHSSSDAHRHKRQ